MAVSTDRFKVKSVRPAAHLHTSEVPQDLQDRLHDRVVTADDLKELGADIETANLYHGGKSQAVIFWHGDEYVVDLEPAS